MLHAQAEEIINERYDLIFTIGAATTQTIAELLNKKCILTPHVFCGIEGPFFVKSINAINQKSTGIYIKSHYKKEIDMLYQYKQNIKNILLVYDPTQSTGLERHKREIEEHVKKYGTILHSIEVYRTNEIQQKVATLLPSMDVVLVLIDNTVV